jgi:hypothetical protein
MRSLLKLLIVTHLLGTAVQQGWLQAGARQAAVLLGGPPGLDPAVGVDALVTLRAILGGLAGRVASLPDPWHGLALAVGGMLALLLLASAVRVAVRTTIRLSGWLRDTWV